MVLQAVNDLACILETPLKLWPSSSAEKTETNPNRTQGDQIVLEQSLNDIVGNKSCPTICSNDVTNIATSIFPGNSSPGEKGFTSGGQDAVKSSPVSVASSPLLLEMISSPEPSPLPDNINDFDMAMEYGDLQNSQSTSFSNTAIGRTHNYVSDCKDVEGCLDTCVSIVSPELRTISPLQNLITEDHVERNGIKEMANCSGLEARNAKLVDQKCLKERNVVCDDSLLDLFGSASDSTTENSPEDDSKECMTVENCSNKDIITLSPKSTDVLSPSHSSYSFSTKNKEIGVSESETELKKVDYDQHNKRYDGLKVKRAVKQSLRFQSKDVEVKERKNLNQESRLFRGESETKKVVKEPMARSISTLTDCRLDDSFRSIHLDEVDSDDIHLNNDKMETIDIIEIEKRNVSRNIAVRNFQISTPKNCYNLCRSSTSKQIEGDSLLQPQVLVELDKIRRIPSALRCEVQNDVQEHVFGGQSTASERNDETPNKLFCGSTDNHGNLLDGSVRFKDRPYIQPEMDDNLDGDCAQFAAGKRVIETPKSRFGNKVTKVAHGLLNETSRQSKKTLSNLSKVGVQEDLLDDMNKFSTRQSCSVTEKVKSWLDDSSKEAKSTPSRESNEETEDQCNEFHDDNAFNYEIDEYFTYDDQVTCHGGNMTAENDHAVIQIDDLGVENDNLVMKNDRLAVKTGHLSIKDHKTGNPPANPRNDTETKMEEVVNNELNVNASSGKSETEGHVKATENKMPNTRKDTKKGTNTNAPQNRKNTGKQVKTKNVPQLQEFKLREPRTPMLNYSNMATPELKVMFCPLFSCFFVQCSNIFQSPIPNPFYDCVAKKPKISNHRYCCLLKLIVFSTEIARVLNSMPDGP